jgi:hypothetical protein
MPLPQIVVWFRREDYDAIRRLSPNDPDLPDTFAEWLRITTEQVAKLELKKVPIKKMVIDPKQLAEYCRRSKIKPDRVGREAFAVARAHGKY